MAMHSASVVAEERFRHKGRGLAIIKGRVLDYILKEHDVVGRAKQGRVSEIDLALSSRRNLVVMHLRLDADGLEVLHNVGAQILKRIDGGQRHIALFVPHAIAEVILAAAGVPYPLSRIEIIAGAVDLVVIADRIEYKKLRLRPEVAVIGDVCKSQIAFGARGGRARVEFVALFGHRVDGIGEKADRGLFEKGIDPEPVRVGDEQHIRLVD
jgi:hypothetical protein